jgi:hypothetical protein
MYGSSMYYMAPERSGERLGQRFGESLGETEKLGKVVG